MAPWFAAVMLDVQQKHCKRQAVALRLCSQPGALDAHFLMLRRVCCRLLQAAAAEFAKLKKPTTMSEDMDEQQQQQEEGSEEEEWEDEEDEDDMPSYEFRFECAKMLLELDDTTETAIQVGAVLSCAVAQLACVLLLS